MKEPTVFLLLLMAGSAGVAADNATELVSIEDFARAPLCSQVQISPDRRTRAFLGEFEGKPVLTFADLTTLKAKGLNAGTVPWRGALIHGYMTSPKGQAPKNLPLVVMPHGGPWVRDVWSFDPLVQMLANRGSAVLQMNYRGSPGYGVEFSRIAKHEIGRGIQDDIEDGARWAIAHGIADRSRCHEGGDWRSAAAFKWTRHPCGGSNREAFADQFLGVTDDAFDQLEIKQTADIVGAL